MIGVLAIALGALIWSGHRAAAARAATTRARALQAAAADWTGVLINMNADNVDASMQKLHDGTVGDLNSDFDASITPYREVVKTLQARPPGRSSRCRSRPCTMTSTRWPGQRPPAPADAAGGTGRPHRHRLVVATSVSENAGNKPATVRWNLRLGVSDVDGKLMISRLESLR